MGGEASYTDLVTCMEMARDVRENYTNNLTTCPRRTYHPRRWSSPADCSLTWVSGHSPQGSPPGLLGWGRKQGAGGLIFSSQQLRHLGDIACNPLSAFL